MKFVRVLTLLLAGLFQAASMQAAGLNVQGLTGMLAGNTADTAGEDESYLNLGAGLDAYIETAVPNSSNRDLDIWATPALLYGVTDRLELGMYGRPFLLVDSLDYGIRDIGMMGKYRLAGGREKGYGVALGAFGSLFKADATRNVGTETSSYGGELILSRYGLSSGLHFSIGSVADDVRTTGAVPGFVSENMLTANLGVEVDLLPELTLTMEALASRVVKNKDDNLRLVPGVRFRTSDNVSYAFGIGYGVPSDRSRPEVRYLASITMALGDQKPFTPVTTRMDNQDSALAELESKMAGLEQSMAENAGNKEMEERLVAMESEYQSLLNQMIAMDTMIEHINEGGLPSNAVRVAIVNASGMDRLGRVVAAVLRRKGYRIRSIVDIRQAVQTPSQIFYKGGASKNAEVMRIAEAKLALEKVTTIYYRKGFDEVAVALGHVLPKNQLVFRGKNLDERIDLKVVVGRDMKLLLRSEKFRR